MAHHWDVYTRKLSFDFCAIIELRLVIRTLIIRFYFSLLQANNASKTQETCIRNTQKDCTIETHT